LIRCESKRRAPVARIALGRPANGALIDGAPFAHSVDHALSG
jgi:hypothetical protein